MREKFENVFGEDKTVLAGLVKHTHRGISSNEVAGQRSGEQGEESMERGLRDKEAGREARGTFIEGQEEEDEVADMRRRDLYRRLLKKKDVDDYFTFNDDWDDYRKHRRSMSSKCRLLVGGGST